MKHVITILLLCASLLSSMQAQVSVSDASLRAEADSLLTEWMDTFLSYQSNMSHPSLNGGIICPACARIHGRIGDAVLPLMYLAHKTSDPKYLVGAKRLMAWMENVHRPDGAWMNDVHVSDWNGTTVFASIALYEALHNYGHLLDDSTRCHWTRQLEQAGEFMMNNPFIYSRKRDGMRNMNINYSASATYALYAVGSMCNRPEFMAEARQIADGVKAYFTENNCFLFGEGPNIWTATKNGCRPVDLLYNVEESLPALAQYAIMAGDDTLLSIVERSMDTHLEFMLPDGAWDNSWGTRSFKWTYWGGRTSDGFMGGYYLLSDRHPVYREAILRNIRLLRAATHSGLLHGGMHYHSSGIAPCIHHTFGHAKALASFLGQKPVDVPSETTLPRDRRYGMKYFQDIRTWLLSEGPWRATLTGYDAEYKVKGTHPMGGALSMLWHEQAGPIFAATMNRYNLIEAPNMQSNERQYLIGGTPRVEIMRDGISYSNLDDLDTDIHYSSDGHKHQFQVTANLVDFNQKSPADGFVRADITYTCTPSGIDISVQCPNPDACLMLPVIASQQQQLSLSSREASVAKADGCGRLIVSCARGHIEQAPADTDGRIFNPVPGFAFVPLRVVPDRGNILISISYQ